MFQISSDTSEEGRKRFIETIICQELQVQLGIKVKTIALNGGSQTRRDTRRFYEDLYKNSSFVEVVSTGYEIRIRKKR